MIKYYVINVEGGDVSKAVSSLCEYQNVEQEDITVIDGGLQQVFSIPVEQGYDGKAVALLSSSYLANTVDVDNFITDGCVMMRDPFDRLFVLDCSNPFYKNAIGPKTNLNNFTSFNVGSTSLWRIAVDLSGNVGPDIIPVNEPEPSDFEIETWVPQDEFPDNGE